MCTGTFEELCANDAVRNWIQSELVSVGKADKLKGFEIVKKVFVDPKPFDVENELLTPTFKLKRPQLQKHYQAQIDSMYKALGE